MRKLKWRSDALVSSTNDSDTPAYDFESRVSCESQRRGERTSARRAALCTVPLRLRNFDQSESGKK